MNTALLISHILLWTLLLVVTGLLLATIRQIGLIHRRIEPFGARTVALGPGVGDIVPDFELQDLRGRTAFLASRHGKRTLLVFMSSHCSTCEEVAPAIRSIARSERKTTDTILIFDGAEEEVQTFASRVKLSHMRIVAADDMREFFGVSATPFALLIDESGTLQAKGIINHFEHIESLIRAAELEVDSIETFLEGVDTQARDQAPRKTTTEGVS